MTDLRDQLDQFEAAARRLLDNVRPRLALVVAKPARCHPARPMTARGLCRSCYETAWRAQRLNGHPTTRTRRVRIDFVADYQVLRSEGYTRAQIAERLGMTRDAVNAAYSRAVRAGDLTPDRRTA